MNGECLNNYDYLIYIASGVGLSDFNVTKRHAVQMPYKSKEKPPYSVLQGGFSEV